MYYIIYVLLSYDNGTIQWYYILDHYVDILAMSFIFILCINDLYYRNIQCLLDDAT